MQMTMQMTRKYLFVLDVFKLLDSRQKHALLHRALLLNIHMFSAQETPDVLYLYEHNQISTFSCATSYL